MYGLPASIAVFMMLGGLPASGMHQSDIAKTKAAYLYNFTKYVTWPSWKFATKSSPIIIGIVGKDSLGGSLDKMVTGKQVGGRNLVVRHFHWGEDLSKCHELFVPADEVRHASQLDPLKTKPVLIVGESHGFARGRAAINFFLEDGKVRFEINQALATRVGLGLSSKLLALGRSPK